MEKKFGEARQRNPRMIISILVVVILLLIGFIAYAFFVVPSINGYVIQKQIDARDAVLTTIISQVNSQGYVQISDAEGNSLVLVPVSPDQIQAQNGDAVQEGN